MAQTCCIACRALMLCRGTADMPRHGSAGTICPCALSNAQETESAATTPVRPDKSLSAAAGTTALPCPDIQGLQDRLSAA